MKNVKKQTKQKSKKKSQLNCKIISAQIVEILNGFFRKYTSSSDFL